MSSRAVARAGSPLFEHSSARARVGSASDDETGPPTPDTAAPPPAAIGADMYEALGDESDDDLAGAYEQDRADLYGSHDVEVIDISEDGPPPHAAASPGQHAHGGGMLDTALEDVDVDMSEKHEASVFASMDSAMWQAVPDLVEPSDECCVFAPDPSHPQAAAILDPARPRNFPQDPAALPKTRAVPAVENQAATHTVERDICAGSWTLMEHTDGDCVIASRKEGAFRPTSGTRYLSCVVPMSVFMQGAPTIAHVNPGMSASDRLAFLVLQLFLIYVDMHHEGHDVRMVRGKRSMVCIAITKKPPHFYCTTSGRNPSTLQRLQDLFSGSWVRDPVAAETEWLPVTPSSICMATGCSAAEAERLCLINASNRFNRNCLFDILFSANYLRDKSHGTNIYAAQPNNLEYAFGNSFVLSAALERSASPEFYDEFIVRRVRILQTRPYDARDENEDEDADDPPTGQGQDQAARATRKKLIHKMGIVQALIEVDMIGGPLNTHSTWKSVFYDVAPDVRIFDLLRSGPLNPTAVKQISVSCRRGTAVFGRIAGELLEQAQTTKAVVCDNSGGLMPCAIEGIPAVTGIPVARKRLLQQGDATVYRATPEQTAKEFVAALHKETIGWQTDLLPGIAQALKTLADSSEVDTARQVFSSIADLDQNTLESLADLLCVSSVCLLIAVDAGLFSVSRDGCKTMLVMINGESQAGKSAAFHCLNAATGVRVVKIDSGTELGLFLLRATSTRTFIIDDDGTIWTTDGKRLDHQKIRDMITSTFDESRTHTVGTKELNPRTVRVEPSNNVEVIISNNVLKREEKASDRSSYHMIPKNVLTREQTMRGAEGASRSSSGARMCALRVMFSIASVVFVALEAIDGPDTLSHLVLPMIIADLLRYNEKTPKHPARTQQIIIPCARRMLAISEAIRAIQQGYSVERAIARAVRRGPCIQHIVAAIEHCLGDKLPSAMQEWRARWKEAKRVANKLYLQKIQRGAHGNDDDSEILPNLPPGYTPMPTTVLMSSLVRKDGDSVFKQLFLNTHCSLSHPPPRPDIPRGTFMIAQNDYAHADAIEEFTLTHEASELLLEMMVALETHSPQEIRARAERACALFSEFQALSGEAFVEEVNLRHPEMPTRRVAVPPAPTCSSPQEAARRMFAELCVDVSNCAPVQALLQKNPDAAQEIANLRVGPYRHPVLLLTSEFTGGNTQRNKTRAQVLVHGLFNFVSSTYRCGLGDLIHLDVPVEKPQMWEPLCDTDPMMFGDLYGSRRKSCRELMRKARALPVVGQLVRMRYVLSRFPAANIEEACAEVNPNKITYERLLGRAISPMDFAAATAEATWECADIRDVYTAPLRCVPDDVDVQPEEQGLERLPYVCFAIGQTLDPNFRA